MADFAKVLRMFRMRKMRNRRSGQSMQRSEGNYETDGLSKLMTGSQKSNAMSESIQRKIAVGKADDAYEKEADRMADKVVAKESAGADINTGPALQKQEEEEAQTKSFLQKQEEEEAQPKFLQKQEEEEAQTKPLLQMKGEEEEEAMQAKPLMQLKGEEEEEAQPKLLQKKEEEEEAQAKPLLQMKGEEEEEAMQAKPLMQLKGEEEEEAQPKLLQKQEEEEEAQAKSLLQKKGNSNTVDSSTTSRLNARKGQGSPISGKARNFMESSFKKDFSSVRIHTDSEASGIAQKMNAQAFALGKDVYFNKNKYNPESKEGKHLLAHELTHVLQQNKDIKDKKQR